MLFPIPIFLPQFPYVEIKYKEINFFKGRTVYEKYQMGNQDIPAKQMNLIRANRKILREHGVPINKIRFVFQPSFEYDIDKNIINPVYHVFLPLNGNNGKVVKDEPVISISKPDKLIIVQVKSYQLTDNFEFLIDLLHNSKRGIVIMISDEIIPTSTGPKIYKFTVADDVIRVADLDEEVEKFVQPIEYM